MERRGREACRKIDEATQAVSGDEILLELDEDQVSVVRHALALGQAAQQAKIVAGTPPGGSQLPINSETPSSGVRRRR